MAYNPNAQPVSRLNNSREDGTMMDDRLMARPSSLQAGFAGMSPAVAREVATIQGQIMLAKMYPRSMSDIWKKVEAACSRLKLAEAAIYQYSRGGTDISGPSIRLAEALINAFGNAKSGFEVIESGDESSRVRAYAYDMETNTIQERTFDVEHVRYTKKNGRERLTDPRDIYEVIANNASRRERACILALIPGDLQDYAVSLCRKTLIEQIDITPEKVGALINAFAGYGVSKVMIEAKIQRSIDAITIEQYVNLRTIYASLRDSIGTVDDFFDREAKPLGTPEQVPEISAESEPDQKTGKQPSRKPAARKKQAEQPVMPEPADEQMDESGMISSEPEGPENFRDDDFYD